jgi:hypothetical protein
MARYIVAVLDFCTEISTVNDNNIKSPTPMVLANQILNYTCNVNSGLTVNMLPNSVVAV